MEASIIVPAFERSEHLRQTLTSIFDQNQNFNYEILVVDDGGGPEIKQVAEEFGVRYFRLDRPGVWKNPARTFNVGIRNALAPVIIIQHSGIVQLTPAVEQFTNILSGAPRNAVFARVSEGKHVYCGPENKRPFFFLGALRAEYFHAVGGFDEDYTEYGSEDDDFAWRIGGLGVGFIYSTEVQANHLPHDRGAYYGAMPRMRAIFDRKRAAGEILANKNREWGAL